MTLDTALVAECVDLWIETRAKIVTRKPGGQRDNRRKQPLLGPDDLLKDHGITFDGTQKLYQAYERAIRKQASARLGISTHDLATVA